MRLRAITHQYVLLILLALSFSCKNNTNKTEFISIFNGKDLEGWQGDATYWRVENGVLTGEVTAETILKRNSFIIYKNQQPKNFELKLEYKITNSGNSGLNYRSTLIETMPFALRGYQCDIDGKNKYTGQNYEEKKRTTLAYIGETVTIPQMPDSIPKQNIRKNVKRNCWQTRDVSATKLKSELVSTIKPNDWNTIHLKVKDNKMQHYVNDVLFSEVTDLDEANRSTKGYIGVQVHVGPPMKVAFKNIQLKLLK
ncbi:3-keto-disaccharide hydrolase [Jejuia pallidilutea]|jgi:hypothetical protein|uniref:3-keto-alpha-glucoside-1,2-lyase/3-keto-2-hydroxy-glucal hydratase domain-containing protein n=1 Tax=Jejuia pallidilutea TaxID=504487 RepID=A0A090VTB5_9FLAO|nr:DUF1080 domain-containing protein [Jejuia pallidilutea]GAL67258.1 hypothetical protein-transmembrane region and signal peptide prediction [Jejuia pallidilutea]GAL70897.1 hypothetical protein-transmembrane region and signal peptide prediction [Jejuia pallidilutea]GAL89760.1 hypothetical protein-transmembrane region and signal peptide prediction [Jejuia pallidilutea]